MWAAENPASTAPVSSSQLQLSTDTDLSREGYFVLSWTPNPPDTILQLRQSSSPDFSSVINKNVAGTDRVTITGLVDGNYFYRLVADDIVVSNALEVRVEHHSLPRALSFFFLGLLLFTVLLLSIYRGYKLQGANDAS